MNLEIGAIVALVTNVVIIALSYGSLRQRVLNLSSDIEVLRRIVSNGLSDKVNRIDKSVAVLLDRGEHNGDHHG